MARLLPTSLLSPLGIQRSTPLLILEQTMQTTLHPLLVLVTCLLLTSMAHADPPDFSSAVGTVGKFEKEGLTINAGDKSKKTLELKVTGTSKFHLMSPQVRSGKTVITQRSAETSDLTPGQSIAVIYTVVDKENVLLT